MSSIFELHLNEIGSTERTPSVHNLHRIQVDGFNADSELLFHLLPSSPDHRPSSQQDDIKTENIERHDEDTPIYGYETDTCHQGTCAKPNWRQSLPPPTHYRRPTITTVKSLQPVAPQDPMLEMVYHRHRQHIFSMLVEEGDEIACHLPAEDLCDSWDTLFASCAK